MTYCSNTAQCILSRGKNDVGTSYYIQLLRVSLYKSLTAANNVNGLVDERHTTQRFVYVAVDNTTYEQKFSHLRWTEAELKGIYQIMRKAVN